MMADKTSPLVPRLRFPVFQSRRDWPHTTLSAVLEEHGLKSDGVSEVHSVSLAKGVVPQIEHLGRSFAANDTANYNLVRPFDIVYTRSPLSAFPLGIVKQHKSTNNAIVSPLYGVFAPRNRHLGLLIEAYFDSPLRNFRFLDPLAQKGAKNTIQLSNDRFLSVALHLPEDDDEQQKIAECLSNLDELIAAEGRKLEALREHKQGLMQQLFPQPGETVPRLRFPEFCGADEWEEKKIGDLSEVKASGDLNEAYFSNHQSMTHLYPIYSNAVENEGLYGYYSVPQYKKNSVTITARGTLGVAFLRNHEFMGIGRLIVVSDLRDLDPCFLKECWNHLAVIPREVTSIPQLTAIAVRATVLPVPSPAEQQRIATCFSSLDARLAVQVQKINALKTHKQGLLQQLFPSPEVE